ncbi:MAG: hypothetical protein KGR26_09955, partial [Cyanobacteria bacterium REEB65]|nr:hypothetical protein [Cyanobacteria bacterium REEB65]
MSDSALAYIGIATITQLVLAVAHSSHPRLITLGIVLALVALAVAGHIRRRRRPPETTRVNLDSEGRMVWTVGSSTPPAPATSVKNDRRSTEQLELPTPAPNEGLPETSGQSCKRC